MLIQNAFHIYLKIMLRKFTGMALLRKRKMHLNENATHFVFILGTKGFEKVKSINDILENYLKQIKLQKKMDKLVHSYIK